MNEGRKLTLLRVVMVVVGVSLLVATPIGLDLWPAGFRWMNPAPHPPYEHMIWAMFAANGIALLMSVRDPVRNRIIIDFTIISMTLHALVMAWDAIAYEEPMHLLGDVPALLLLALLFFWLRPHQPDVLVRG